MSVIALNTLGDELNAILETITGPKQGPPLPSLGTSLGGCTPPPAALSPLLGSAAATSDASPTGSATVTASAMGNKLVSQSAQVSTDLDAPITLSSPATSVDFTVPYSTTGVTDSYAGPDSAANAFAIVGWGVTPGTIICTDGTRGILSSPQTTLDAPTPASSGTWSGKLACPDGSDLPAGVMGIRLGFLVAAYSANGLTEFGTANLQARDVVATINY